MIELTRLNGKTFHTNPDLIEFIEETPDTVISFQSGRKMVVLEKIEYIVKLIMEFRAKTYALSKKMEADKGE